MSEIENQNGTPAAKAEQLDVLEQLLKPEVQESLTSLVESLPKLTEMVNVMTKSYDFFQSVATDEVLINDFRGGFKEFLKPIEGKAKEVAATAMEAKELAERNEETIGLFGLLRLLKDPQAQKLFRFVQAYLKLTSENEKK
ncbi:uncharacterized protein YjgD (DUF1641 family) [Pullulanibacillus pueri]|uniref:DUF1641 domain-containing protein n=1 Tax=Pullulanibacillus pueri TaxID=1437324 RepID=A0A8J2ZT04_9BACL|nr:DUF1641 domain-containing protein [Pullulanibacillus pueri]MBM7680329.1 uncharacterized protein YjgD (DUF1641 family) [Pullulanibacillus pueri]GGH75626.1 hypothetical protein GCM10007096_05040 [Pullulanibacillus pueri]